ncbi:MAG: hypothetical protein QOK37_4396 [Thermoanaerobaculia bacterium]|nr:hypothetical protein [Thermoanaerobaculia bacterium]
MSRRLSQILITLFLLLAPSLLAQSGWGATAASHRGEDGRRFRYSCGPGGSPASVWGTDIYTDDSSVCTAAVHAGIINAGDGGSVVIEIRSGRQSYEGSYRHGVRSQRYDNWQGSFVFAGGATNEGDRSTEDDRRRDDGDRSRADRRRGREIDWSTKADRHRGENGRRFTYDCPADGERHNVWGSGPYTDDSSICTAAVHAGVIGWDGGTVTIEIRSGRTSYRGSRRNGVESHNYGRWTGSFVFVE